MARLLFPSSAESVTCMRCGNSFLNDAETCPHCGADHGSPRAAENTAAIPHGLRLFSSRRASLAAPSPYPSVPEEAEFAGTGEQRWDNSKTVTLGAVLLALIAGSVIYSQSNEREAGSTEAPAGHSAYGAIDMKAMHEPAAAAMQAKPAPAGAAPAPDTATRVNATAPAPVLPAGVIDNLQAARDAIDRGDLTTARRRLSKIPAAQMSAGNIQRTQSELAGLERTRDNLLQMARACEATGSWICVRQNARDVLAIDASNVEAQTLVEHAINRSGWLNKTPSASAHSALRSNQPAPLATAPSPVAGRGQAFAASTPAAASAFIPMPDGPETPVNTSRTLATGDNAANPAQPRTSARNTTDADAEERAILESGWKKGQPSKLTPALH